MSGMRAPLKQGAGADELHRGFDVGGEDAVRAGTGDLLAQKSNRRAGAGAGCSGARSSTPRAAVMSSMASTRVSPSTARRSLRADDQPMDT
jgi:hypothetical protein